MYISWTVYAKSNYHAHCGKHSPCTGFDFVEPKGCLQAPIFLCFLHRCLCSIDRGGAIVEALSKDNNNPTRDRDVLSAWSMGGEKGPKANKIFVHPSLNILGFYSNFHFCQEESLFGSGWVVAWLGSVGQFIPLPSALPL